MKFIDRMVADSRQVALNHTAGLSLPQQIQMALFSLFALIDTADSYKTLCQLICRRRLAALMDGLGLTLPADETGPPTTWNSTSWSGPRRTTVRSSRVPRGRTTSAPTSCSAWREHSGVVLMHGGGFGGPEWSVRVSLANLAEETYPKIGQYLREAAEAYVKEWKTTKKE